MARTLKRFFTSQNLNGNPRSLKLGKSESHHLKNVLRLKPNDRCYVIDSFGSSWEAAIDSFDQFECVTVTLISRLEELEPSHFRLMIAQGIPQRGKMDIIVEKAAELGVSVLIPMLSERSVVKPAKETFQKLDLRWEKIVQSARKQSGSREVTTIMQPRPFSEIISNSDQTSARFILDPNGRNTTLQAIDDLRAKRASARKLDVMLLIGPEGGFSDKEICLAEKCGIESIRLETPVLKTDTAFVAAASLFLAVLN